MPGLTKLAKRVSRLARDTREAHEESLDGGVLAIMGSGGPLADRLSALLDVPVGERPGADLLIIPLGPGADARSVALEVAARSRQDQRTLVVVVCAPHERPRRERELLAEPDVTIGDLVFVADLEADREISRLHEGIIRAVGYGMVPAARRYPALREPVRHHLVDVAARESALAGALNWFTGSAAAQHTMVVRMGSAEGQGLTAKRIPELAVATATGLAVTYVARGASRVIPAPRWLVRGAIAYASTVALANVAERMSRQMADVEAVDARDAVKSFIRAKLRRKGKS